MRSIPLVLIVLFATVNVLAPASAEDSERNEYVMNFDLVIRHPAGEDEYNIQLQGVRLVADREYHGQDLGAFDYFFTVSSAKDGHALLRIEFYKYESRRKTSEVIAEVVDEVPVTLGSPQRYKGGNDVFGVDLAFSVGGE